MNVITSDNGDPILIVSNMVTKFKMLVNLNMAQAIRLYGNSAFTVKTNTCSNSKRKLQFCVRPKIYEWYAKPPDPIANDVQLLKDAQIYEKVFNAAVNEEKMNSGDNPKIIKEWTEPAAPNCMALLYSKGVVVISGVKTKLHALFLAYQLARHFNESMGIPATVSDFEIRNIVSDSQLGFNVDLKALAASQGSLAVYKPKKFPACVIRDSVHPYEVTLVYDNGNMVETGSKTEEDLKFRHPKMCALVRKFRIDQKSNSQQLVVIKKSSMPIHQTASTISESEKDAISTKKRKRSNESEDENLRQSENNNNTKKQKNNHLIETSTDKVSSLSTSEVNINHHSNISTYLHKQPFQNSKATTILEEAENLDNVNTILHQLDKDTFDSNVGDGIEELIPLDSYHANSQQKTIATAKKNRNTIQPFMGNGDLESVKQYFSSNAFKDQEDVVENLLNFINSSDTPVVSHEKSEREQSIELLQKMEAKQQQQDRTKIKTKQSKKK